MVTNYVKRARSVLAKRRVVGRLDPGPPAPFVCGATRSGTTLLRLMLDAHPEMAIPSETHFVTRVIRRCERQRMSADAIADVIVAHKRWGDFHLDESELRRRLRALRRPTAADSIRAFYGLYAEKQGKPRWGDKTPGYMKAMLRIQRALPEARFIHIIRDGRDVALSLFRLNWGPETPTEAAKLWVARIEKARAQAGRVEHYTEIRFEDLVRETERTLRRVCELIDLGFDPVMLDYHERAEGRLREKARDLRRANRPDQPAELRMQSHRLAKLPPQEDRIGQWRSRMSPEQVAEYEAVAAPMLTRLGYELGAPAAAASR